MAWHMLDHGLGGDAPVHVLAAAQSEDNLIGFAAEVRLARWEAEQDGRLPSPEQRRERKVAPRLPPRY